LTHYPHPPLPITTHHPGTHYPTHPAVVGGGWWGAVPKMPTRLLLESTNTLCTVIQY